MKFLVVLAVAVACASADVSHVVHHSEYDAPIVKSDYEISPEGNFNFAYETGNGIYSGASGVIKNTESDFPAQEVKGAYKYTSPEGVPVEVTYIANEFGYQPQGNHLPVAPPVPELIARSLAYIQAHPPPPVPAEPIPYRKV